MKAGAFGVGENASAAGAKRKDAKSAKSAQSMTTRYTIFRAMIVRFDDAFIVR